MRYTLIVPAWNEAEFLGETLNALHAAMAPLREAGLHDGELLVVDNNSTDATPDIARTHGARVVFEGENRIASARNAGARAAGGEALVFVDADTHVPPALLAEALDRLASGEVVGGGAAVAPDRSVDGLAKHTLSFWNWWSRTRRLAAGCFIYTRRDAFDAVGGFSERVYAGEEIFLSRALKREGARVGRRFEVIDAPPVVTSIRKLDWYRPDELLRQALVVFVPGALMSRRLCRTWYERGHDAHDSSSIEHSSERRT